MSKNIISNIKKSVNVIYSCCDIYLLFLLLIGACIYFMYDDQSYCLDTGFLAGDPMCQADENNKLVIVKE